MLWTKMISRPFPCKFQEQHSKFNTILEEILSSLSNNYIIDLDDVLTNSMFDRNNNLSTTGRIAFWKELDNQLKLFDKQNITLKPKAVVSNSQCPNNMPDKKKKLMSIDDYRKRRK